VLTVNSMGKRSSAEPSFTTYDTNSTELRIRVTGHSALSLQGPTALEGGLCIWFGCEHFLQWQKGTDKKLLCLRAVLASAKRRQHHYDTR
jgi:hypothetical protein